MSGMAPELTAEQRAFVALSDQVAQIADLLQRMITLLAERDAEIADLRHRLETP
jgi:hypothetical protein